MATVKHIKVKNAWYADAVSYLKYQHDEYTNKPILDTDGEPILRDYYLMDGINCEPVSFGAECIKTNRKYGKNNTKGEIKAHHYIISFDPRDKDENGLTAEKAQQLGIEIAQRAFPGFQAVVCTHPDGHNGSGNIHVHIVINSIRKEDVNDPEFVERKSDVSAGLKHNASDRFMEYFKQLVMEICQRENYYQVDLLEPAKVRITDKEYWAQRRGTQEAQITTGSPENRNVGSFETRLNTLREQIAASMNDSNSFEEFREKLFEDYGIEIHESRGRLSYIIPGRNTPIRARRLGTDFEKESLVRFFQRAHSNRNSKVISIGLVADVQRYIKAMENPYYARKVKITNLQEMAKTLAFLQENEIRDEKELSSLCAKSQEDLQQAHDTLLQVEKRLRAANLEIRYLGQYLANKTVYAEYIKSKNKKEFRFAHRQEIELFEASRKQLKELIGGKRLPSMKQLKEEKAELLVKKNSLYDDYCYLRKKQKQLGTAQKNVAIILADMAEPVREDLSR